MSEKNRSSTESILFNVILSVLSAVVGFALSLLPHVDLPLLLPLVIMTILLLVSMVVYSEVGRQNLRRHFAQTSESFLMLARHDNVSVNWTSDFKETQALIENCSASIHIVTAIGDTFEHMGSDKSRSDYLDRIVGVLEAKKSDPRFVYYRVMPARQNARILDGSESVEARHPQLGEHLQKVRSFISDNKGAPIVNNIIFNMCELIPLCPSILVIDEEYICFALPMRRRHKKIRSEASEFQLKGVLMLRDRTGETAREMISLIRTFGDGQTDLIQHESVLAIDGSPGPKIDTR